MFPPEAIPAFVVAIVRDQHRSKLRASRNPAEDGSKLTELRSVRYQVDGDDARNGNMFLGACKLDFQIPPDHCQRD